MIDDKLKQKLFAELDTFNDPKSDVYISDFEQKIRDWLDVAVISFIRRFIAIETGSESVVDREDCRKLMNEWLDTL